MRFYKEVLYGAYCHTCQFRDKDEDEEPCCLCVAVNARVDGHKPIGYKKDENVEETEENNGTGERV